MIAATMPYDERLAERVRAILSERRGVTEKTLMGTLAFMVDGAMCCSVARDGLLVRVGADDRARLLTEPFVSPVKLGARTMKGFVRVAPDGFRTRAKLAKWIARGVEAGVGISRKRPSRRGVSSASARGRKK